MAQIKLVSDTTDAFTRKVLKEKWEKSSPSAQKKMLERMGHSDKFVGSKYSDLTGEIQSKIIIDKKSV